MQYVSVFDIRHVIKPKDINTQNMVLSNNICVKQRNVHATEIRILGYVMYFTFNIFKLFPELVTIHTHTQISSQFTL